MTVGYALLADVGGTNVRFALADTRLAAPLMLDSIRQFQDLEFASLADAARYYLDTMSIPSGGVHTGVFAVAGRIDGDQARITNHPWLISRCALQQDLQLDGLRLVNDFSAQAMAIELLTDNDLVGIGSVPWLPPTGPSRTYAVLGPGTGLGVSALLVRDGQRIALETEGGHISFAPGTAEEAAVLERLRMRYDRVSNERLISGDGLVNIHRALSELAGDAIPAEAPRPHEISAGARRGDLRCQQAVQFFCSVFGAIAGDLVLTLGAWDGVFLTGGVVPKLLTELQASAFRHSFEAKGRFSTAMAKVPTVAMMHPQAGLLGAAAFAMQGAARTPTPVRAR